MFCAGMICDELKNEQLGRCTSLLSLINIKYHPLVPLSLSFSINRTIILLSDPDGHVPEQARARIEKYCLPPSLVQV